MFGLTLPWLKIASYAATAVAVAGFVVALHHRWVEHEAGVYQSGYDKAAGEAKIREQAQMLDYQQRLLSAQQQAKKEQDDLLSAQQERINVAEKTSQQHASDAARAATARSVVQHALDAAIASAASAASASSRCASAAAGPGADCEAAIAAARMSAELFSVSSRLAGIYAKTADDRGSAGQQCQRAYDDDAVRVLQ